MKKMKVINMFKAPNHIFQNWNKELYIATKKEVILDDYGNQIVTYNEPFYFGKVNYQPITRRELLEAYYKIYGETEKSVISLFLDYTEDGKFKTFDLAYLYGANPKGEKQYGENANYIVKAYKPQNTKIMVIFEEIEKEDHNGNN